MRQDRIPDAPMASIQLRDEAAGLEGYVCIHSFGKYGASGGMRCVGDVSQREVELLARAMTYKYSFWDIEQGGAKAGLCIDYDTPDDLRDNLLRLAAEHTEPLIRRGVWSPWTDMNFYGRHLSQFYAGIGIDYRPADSGSSFRTAVSAFASLRAAAEFLGIEPSSMTIALEGFGSVATFLAREVQEWGAKLVAISNHMGALVNEQGLDIDRLLEVKAAAKDSAWTREAGPWENAPREAVFSADCDVFIPCARVHSITGEVARGLRTRFIVPIANVPLNDEAKSAVAQAGIPMIPDYIVNGGGVCGHIMGSADSTSSPSARTFMDHFVPMAVRLMRRAADGGVTMTEVADEVAHRNYAAMQRDVYRAPGVADRITSALRSRNMLPAPMMQRMLTRRVEKTLTLMRTAFTG